MSSTEEQIIKLETRVSEIRGLLVSNGLQEDFTSEVQKIDFDLEVQRKTLKTLRRRLAPNNDKEVNLTLSKLKLLEVQALKLTSWSTPSLFQWLMTQKDYLRANPLCGTILQSVYVHKLVDSLQLHEPVVLASLRSQLDVKSISDFTDWVTTKFGSPQYQTTLALGPHKKLGPISWPVDKNNVTSTRLVIRNHLAAMLCQRSMLSYHDVVG